MIGYLLCKSRKSHIYFVFCLSIAFDIAVCSWLSAGSITLLSISPSILCHHSQICQSLFSTTLAMNQHSPGRRTAEDALEMVDVRQNVLSVQNGDADNQDDEDADDNQALLRTGSPSHRHLGRKILFVEIWPQIRGIVVEVSADCLKMIQ